MTFQNLPVSLCGVAALLLACQPQEGPQDDSSNAGSGASTAAGATAGMPGTPASGGSAGAGLGGAGLGGTPALGGMGGTPDTAGSFSGGAPGGSGAEATGGAPLGGSAGLAGSDGGAPAAGMSGAGAGGTGMAGTGGDVAAAGTGGSVEGAGMGGMSAAAGTGGAAVGCSDGCAELSVPFTVWKAGQYFEIYLNSATDLSTAVISVKARKLAGKAGGMLIVVKDGSAQSYAYAQGAWNAVSDMTGEFTTYTLDVAAPSSTDMNNTFTPTAVQIITVQLAAGDPWYTDTEMTIEDPTALVNPTVIQIDEITVTGTGTLPGPWAFTSSATDLKATITDDGVNATPPYAVTGSTVTWVGP